MYLSAITTYKASSNESSSSKAELGKCYKRIADLEIRVHDLSIAASTVSNLEVR